MDYSVYEVLLILFQLPEVSETIQISLIKASLNLGVQNMSSGSSLLSSLFPHMEPEDTSYQLWDSRDGWLFHQQPWQEGLRTSMDASSNRLAWDPGSNTAPRTSCPLGKRILSSKEGPGEAKCWGLPSREVPSALKKEITRCSFRLYVPKRKTSQS